jgi:hypothetical protein
MRHTEGADQQARDLQALREKVAEALEIVDRLIGATGD